MAHPLMTPLVLAAAAHNDPTLWYLTRATSVASYVALSVSVMLGILRSLARRTNERLSWIVDEVHQYLSTLAVVLVAGHLITLLLDPFLPFSVKNLIVPINEPYRQTAVTYGIFALYTMIVLWLSSWNKNRLPYTFWRNLHYLSFVAFVLVTLHGWQAGSDTGEPFMRGIYIGCSAAIAFLTVMRVFAQPRKVAVVAPQASQFTQAPQAIRPHTNRTPQPIR